MSVLNGMQQILLLQLFPYIICNIPQLVGCPDDISNLSSAVPPGGPHNSPPVTAVPIRVLCHNPVPLVFL